MSQNTFLLLACRKEQKAGRTEKTAVTGVKEGIKGDGQRKKLKGRSLIKQTEDMFNTIAIFSKYDGKDRITSNK